MSKRPFNVTDEHIREVAIQAVRDKPLGFSMAIDDELVKEKTLEQLGTIFGLWADYVSNQTGETVTDLHKKWKGMFLCRIYRENPRKGKQQEWVDVLYHLQMQNDIEGLILHAKTVSLKLATVKQTKEYMTRIEQYYITHDMPLPPPERDPRKR